MDLDAAAEEDENAKGDEDITIMGNSLPIIDITKTSPRKNKGKQKKVSHNPSFISNISSTKSSRKRGFGEFEQFLDVMQRADARKRTRDMGIEYIKRMEVKGVMKLRRMELEMVERAEERKHEYVMERLRVLGL